MWNYVKTCKGWVVHHSHYGSYIQRGSIKSYIIPRQVVFPDRHYLFYETVEVAGHQAFIVAIYKGV